jgi:hypothetical protein
MEQNLLKSYLASVYELPFRSTVTVAPSKSPFPTSCSSHSRF